MLLNVGKIFNSTLPSVFTYITILLPTQKMKTTNVNLLKSENAFANTQLSILFLVLSKPP